MHPKLCSHPCLCTPPTRFYAPPLWIPPAPQNHDSFSRNPPAFSHPSAAVPPAPDASWISPVTTRIHDSHYGYPPPVYFPAALTDSTHDTALWIPPALQCHPFSPPCPARGTTRRRTRHASRWSRTEPTTAMQTTAAVGAATGVAATMTAPLAPHQKATVASVSTLVKPTSRLSAQRRGLFGCMTTLPSVNNRREMLKIWGRNSTWTTMLGQLQCQGPLALVPVNSNLAPSGIFWVEPLGTVGLEEQQAGTEELVWVQ
ncbi:hypothetical protein K438DRAFT_280165 [Mycena galopus ATCC 62051]|nr:hypothetical protein K438DRAFT_280165 [Mycena galopus ATCC 62051]